MIVSRGLGRKDSAAAGIIVAAGLGLVLTLPLVGGGIPWEARTEPQKQTIEILARLDDMDILEIVPIVVEVINGRR